MQNVKLENTTSEFRELLTVKEKSELIKKGVAGIIHI
jgi:hypothetical protein